MGSVGLLLECPLVISSVPELHSVGLLLECPLAVILPLLLAFSSLTTALVVCPPRYGLSVPIRLVLHPSCGKSWVLHLLVVLSPSLCVCSSKSVAAAISSATPVLLYSATSGLEVLLLLLLLLVNLGLCGGSLPWSYVPIPIIGSILLRCLLLPGILRWRLLTGHHINRCIVGWDNPCHLHLQRVDRRLEILVLHSHGRCIFSFLVSCHSEALQRMLEVF